MKEKSVGVIIFRNRKSPVYLLLHSPAGHWDFVKGNVEQGETEEETLRREAKEEAGISDLSVLDGFRETIHYVYRRGTLINKEVILYIAETKQERVTLSAEHQAFTWLPFNDALLRITFDASKKVLSKAHAFITVTT